MRTARAWVFTLAAVSGMLITGALGQWQLGRAAQKLALQSAIQERNALAALPQSALLEGGDPADLVHRAVVLRGTWAAPHTVFLDNRQMSGRPGFYVVTPLQLAGSARAVLVQRGWAPRNFIEREKLPSVETPDGLVEVRGRIAPAPAKLYEFEGASEGPIRQNLDLDRFAAETGLALLAGSVVQTGVPSEGLLRDWPQPATGVEKHYGYAFQWWALCALIAFLYVWFQFIAPRRRPPRA